MFLHLLIDIGCIVINLNCTSDYVAYFIIPIVRVNIISRLRNRMTILTNNKYITIAAVYNVLIILFCFIPKLRKTVSTRRQVCNLNFTLRTRHKIFFLFLGSLFSRFNQCPVSIHCCCKFNAIIQAFKLKFHARQCGLISLVIADHAFFLKVNRSLDSAVFRVNSNIIKPFLQLAFCCRVTSLHSRHRNRNQKRGDCCHNRLRHFSFDNQIQAQSQIIKLCIAVLVCHFRRFSLSCNATN